MNKILDKINSHLESRKSGDEGSMLFDVLLGMAIFALIAVIGILSAGKLRERAYVIQATSDAKQVGTAIEAALTAPNATWAANVVGSPAWADGNAPTALEIKNSLGANVTNGVAVRIEGTQASGQYTVCAVSNTGWAIYDASAGAVSSSGTGTLPAECTA